MDFEIERLEVGSEYDLRQSELQQIGQLVASVSEQFVNVLSTEDSEKAADFCAVCEELAYRIGQKVPDDERENLDEFLSSVQREKRRAEKGKVNVDRLRSFRRQLIQLRESANLSLPSDTKTEEGYEFLD
jgi:hypothetical protein